ncbi:hypothetical protein F3Y22_tig00110607pilonHSYRG00050 [Hibiscus syriacus]|uniref:Uncharacterized protein n=1 Tax=Hibiscus syriacus TaxID=106335 RepID=A0A6A3A269_HIBSY|nr:hypothetical protein F3Y22_tig00110607pilonHSYRG00050 [Hibiscus syriacus]
MHAQRPTRSPCTPQHAGHLRPSDRGHPNELCEGIRGQPSELCEGIRGQPSEGRSPGVHGDLPSLGCPRMPSHSSFGWPRMLSDGLGRMASDASVLGRAWRPLGAAWIAWRPT